MKFKFVNELYSQIKFYWNTIHSVTYVCLWLLCPVTAEMNSHDREHMACTD